MWTEDLFGNGPDLAFDHVQIPAQWLKHIECVLFSLRSLLSRGPGAGPSRSHRPPTERETELLLQLWGEDEINSSSRMASQVELTKELDGMVVFIPDGIPYEGNH